jgi:hypothetical protein
MDAYMQGSYDATHEGGFNARLFGGVFSGDFWKYTGTYLLRRFLPSLTSPSPRKSREIDLADLSNRLGQ